MSNFNNLELDNSFYLMRDNTLKKPKKEKNDSQNWEKDITICNNLEKNVSNLPKKELLEINSGNIKTLCQSKQAWASPILYFGQISYGFATILKRLVDNSSQHNSNLAIPETFFSPTQFTITRVA